MRIAWEREQEGLRICCASRHATKRQTTRASTEKVQRPACCFPSIEKKDGQPIAHWLQVLAAAGDLTHMQRVALLKKTHGLGDGHANARVAHHLAKR